jgi:hypothetical protein
MDLYDDAYQPLVEGLEEDIHNYRVITSILRGSNPQTAQQPIVQHLTVGSVDSMEVSRPLVKDIRKILKLNALNVHTLNSMQKTIQPLLLAKLNRLTPNRENSANG